MQEIGLSFFRHAKGLELALKYNFVTDVTSLVITRPELGNVAPKNVEIVSLDKDGSSFADTSPNFSANNDDEKYSFDYDDNNDDGVAIKGSSSDRVPLRKTPASSNKFVDGECKIKLFSKTYLRGEEMELSADAATLGNFDKRTTSIEVRGRCCWTLYTEPNFNGDEKNFVAGQFQSFGDLDNIFRKVSSVKMSDKC